ncbi:MAG: acetate/propionate family kinase [Spirochaetes bacterium]|nr:acetate/propionate family kinase [Spirochaetota bacterium]
MNVLVINCGSSSLKYQVIDLDSERTLLAGNVSRIGMEGAEHAYNRSGEKKREGVKAPDHCAAIHLVLIEIVEDERVPVKSISELAAVAHRVGHGGEKYRGPAIIDSEVKDEVRRLIPLMPLHHPAMLAGIEACQEALPDVPHVAVFDTAFHGTIPEEAAVYGLPYEFLQKGIRKYGFHGNSHEYVAAKAAEFLETPLRRLNIITCHLGNGCSVCAVERGRSIETSMGFGPLPGLLMGTRVGDLDPGIIGYLMESEGYTIGQIDELMHRKSGLLGLSGKSSDMREVLDAAGAGDHRALLAIKVFCYRLKFYVGAYLAAMGGAHAIVFTGGIGEHSRGIRARSLQGLERLGIAVDPVKNDRCEVDAVNPVFDISAPYSRVAVLAVATNEELMIARQCARAIDYRKRVQCAVLGTDRRPIRISVSVRHAHLCRRDVEALFGKGHVLTEKNRLFIDSEFASQETVNLIGKRGRVDGVRIIGPERSRTQVEISRTEEFILGIDAPIRQSGDLEGSPGIILEGPAGRVDLPEGVICAMRHIHMAPEDAAEFGVRDGDVVMVRIEGDRELIFGNVMVRVKEGYRLEMHIDTDEANAAELPPVTEGYLVRIESCQG